MRTHTHTHNSMPVKLFPVLRLLNNSVSVAHFHTMKPIPPIKSASRFTPIYSRIFPHKLWYQILGVSRLTHNRKFGVRRFSTRPSRIRSASGSEVRASKSLIEDEAELSDWVSGLRSDSFHKTRLYSDSDNEAESGGFEGRNKRSREDRGGKRREREFYDDDVDYDDYNVANRGRGPRDSFDSIFRNSKGRWRFGGDLDRENDGFRTRGRRENGFRGGDLEGQDDGFRSTGRENAFRVGNDFSMGRKGRNAAFVNARGRDAGRAGGGRDRGLGSGGKNMRRGGLVESGEDNLDDYADGFGEREKIVKGFSELVSEEESEDEIDDDGDDDLFNEEGADSPIASSRSSSSGSDSYLSETRFDQCPLSPLSLNAIKDAGYEKMTMVQEATLPVILKGKDVLAKARTGTGKTIAFLLPSIEVVAKSDPAGLDQKRPPILVLVICPTRELASQAASEANTLSKYHPSISIQVVIGGTRLALEQKRMQANPCQILVATPGRLRDHIENTAGFATRLMGVKVLVLDEADHLLDMGFRKDIENIIAAVPKQRQTLLFSATIPQEVRQICHIALKRDHEFINTVQEGSEETHSQVEQMHLVAPLDNHFSILYALLKEHIADNVDYKVLVFCTTAMVTRLVADLLGALNLNVREIHSRKPQSYRTRVSDEFRKSKGLILVTSDVSARGVDYPDVTLVVQVGLPSDRQQYIHRLGRTGRKGREGQGLLLLAPWEKFFLSVVKDLPITKAPIPLVDPDTRKKVEKALSHVEMKNKEAAYQAWLGYYNSNKNVGRDKYRLVELANEFSRSMGLDNPPAIPKLVLGKMGLRNIPGLRSR